MRSKPAELSTRVNSGCKSMINYSILSHRTIIIKFFLQYPNQFRTRLFIANSYVALRQLLIVHCQLLIDTMLVEVVSPVFLSLTVRVIVPGCLDA